MGERKGTAQGALNSLGLRILNQSKIELSLSMRYLSRALDKLSFQMDFNTRRIGTEGEKIHFHPEFVFQLYVESPQKLYRLYMHSLLHCLFRHMFKTEDKEEELWNLATDIHVEYVLDSMDIPLLYRPAYPFRENYFQKLEKEVKSLSAERIYAYLLEQNLSYEEKERLELEFVKDDHSFWAKLSEEERPVNTEDAGDTDDAENSEEAVLSAVFHKRAEIGFLMAETYDNLSDFGKRLFRPIIRSQIDDMHHVMLLHPNSAARAEEVKAAFINLNLSSEGRLILEEFRHSEGFAATEAEEVENMLDLLQTLED